MSLPDLTDADRQAVMEVLNTPNLSMGPKVDAFEESVARYVGAKHAIAVNSGTAGLHLCVRAAEIGERDLVITTQAGFAGTWTLGSPSPFKAPGPAGAIGHWEADLAKAGA